jgi:molybdopterin converting factor small subunit
VKGPVPSSDAGADNPRRRILRSALLFSAVGAGVLLGLEGWSKAGALALVGGRAPTSSSGARVASGGSLTVSVAYYGMPREIASAKQESFTLESPAYVRDLLARVVQLHPFISAMIPTMIVSVDGNPGVPGTPLRDGDEVTLVPAVVGG